MTSTMTPTVTVSAKMSSSGAATERWGGPRTYDAAVRFRILGRVQVTDDDGREVVLGSDKERALLAALLLHRGRAVAAPVLADGLWAGEPPRTAIKTLQTYVLRLRGRLGRTTIETVPTGYRLAVAPEDVDATAFEALLSAPRPGMDWAEAVGRALGAWRGRPYEDLADWLPAMAEAARLEELRRLAEEERARWQVGSGCHAEAVGDLEALVAAEPFREARWELLMLALYRSGRQADALRAYQRARAALCGELGIEPGAALRDLEQAILVQAPGLEPPESPRWERASLLGQWGAGTGGGTGAGPGRSAVAGAGQAAMWPPASWAGAVALLFTEIVASAALWERYPAAMPEAVAAQRAAIERAVKAHGGSVLQAAGDDVQAVFPRAGPAVAAALDAQRALAAQDWDTTGELEVGMALHAGSVEERDGRLFGPAIHRVTGLAQAAAGGQVLVSAAAAELARPELAEGHLLDLGTWSFPGIQRAERVFQLVHDCLARAPARLRSGQPGTGTLPLTRTNFVGRQAEGEEVASLLGSSLVTLTGEGGVGKTRLALEVARSVRERYPGGAWFCDLAPVSDGGEVVGQVAATLGIRPEPAGPELEDTLVGALRFADLLLVLDNCEQVAAAAGNLCRRLSQSSSGLGLLATSRCPLQVPGERVVRLAPLAVAASGSGSADGGGPAPAVRLLLDRAHAAGVALDPDDPALTGIAGQLDGLPLALELAAPRLVSLTTADLLDCLSRPFDFDLLASPVASPPRHRTLRATLDWSYGLLSESARRLLAACSVCSQGWTLEAAHRLGSAVGVPPRAATRVMVELTEQSLVKQARPLEGEGRYQMLQTVRHYAMERLTDQGGREAVARAHADYYTGLAERAAAQCPGPQEGSWACRLEAELGNLRAAFRSSRESGWWDLAGRLLDALTDELVMRERLEVGRWGAALLEEEHLDDHQARAAASAVAANLAMVEGRMADAVALSLDALGAEHPGCRSWLARNNLVLLSAVGLGPGRAQEHLAAMAAEHSGPGEPMAVAVALFDRALVASFTSRPEDGLAPSEQLVALGRRLASPSVTAMGLLSIGRARLATSPEVAGPALHQALDLALAARSSLLAREATRALIELRACQGDRAQALEALGHLLVQFRASGDLTQQLQTILSMLDTLVALEEPGTAAVVCAALANTPFGASAQCRSADRLVRAKMSEQDYAAARRLGLGLTPAELGVLVAERVEHVVHASSGA